MVPFTGAGRQQMYANHFYKMVAKRYASKGDADIPKEYILDARAIHESAEYLLFVEYFYRIVDNELMKARELWKKNDLAEIVRRAPAIISMVNCIGYFRGQEGFFLDERPQPLTDIQNNLRQMEDHVEEQLGYLIKILMSSDAVKDAYQEKLLNYFVKSRLGNGRVF